MGAFVRAMDRRPASWLAIAAGGLALAGGCKHVPLDAAAPPVAGPIGGSPERLEAGRAIYVGETRCARCHRPKPVADYPAGDWTNRILPRMARRSKLTPREYEDVQAYILASLPALGDREPGRLHAGMPATHKGEVR